ncbi:hypothetical protein [Bacillus sp. JCM 19034]|uniref:hypothetical protein n=1 Tax=Bacillus sp. JCM 19034 TaxID=1481928 RepID=UPI000A48B427|nr:hypothetical protein [Bacillus sp. JCM 19034]
MTQSREQDSRKEILSLQKEQQENIVKAQKIVLQHLEQTIEERDSATVAAMAEILKI